MGTSVEAPKPSPEENALRAEQTELLRAQREILMAQQEQQRALLPLFAAQMGIELEFDDQGNVIGGERIADPTGERQRELLERQLDVAEQSLGLQRQTLEQALRTAPVQERIFNLQAQLLEQQLKEATTEDPLADRRQEIEELLLERSEKALKGELPVDPALERNIEEQREVLRARLQEQLGPGFETSTPGIEALQRFEESAEVLRDQARRGQLSLSEQLSLARQGADIAQGQFTSGLAGLAPNFGSLELGGQLGLGFGQSSNAVSQNQFANLGALFNQPLGIAGGFGQVASGFELPIGQLQFNRQQEFDARIANATSNAAGLNAIGGVFGTLFGGPFGKMLFSDRRLKYDLEDLGATLRGVPIYAFTMAGVRRLGVMAQDVLRVMPEAVSFDGAFMKVDYGRLRHG